MGSAFSTRREVSAQETVYRLLSIPMKLLSRSVVFVDTNPKKDRISALKDSAALSQLDDDDTKKNLVGRYTHRPRDLHYMCLAEFASPFVTNYQKTEESDVLAPSITLTDGYGKMNRRGKEAVIRFHRYNKDAEPTNYCSELLNVLQAQHPHLLV